MSSAKLTVSAIFSTIHTTAQSVTDLVSTAGQGINMLSNYVGSEQKKQKIRIASDMVGYKEQVQNAKATEIAENQILIEEFCDKSPAHKKHFEAAYARIEAALANGPT